jgi:hypothetical protein
MDANKIKFIDDDGSVEVLEPPMTARVHVETPIQEENTGPNRSERAPCEAQAPYTIQERVSQTIEEESSSDEDIIVVSSSVDSSVEDLKSSVEDLKSSVEDLSGEILNSEEVKGAEAGEAGKEPLNEEVIDEQHVKELEKMKSVILGSGIASSVEAMQCIPDVIKINEVKVPEKEEIDKESLSIVANAVQDVRVEEHKQITPKGCCILQ